MTDASAALEAIHRHLDDNPGDADARGELADLLQDEGRHAEAELQRWMIESGKWPGHERSGLPPAWWWYSKADPIADSPNVLPAELFEALQRGPLYWKQGAYRTRRDAERALLVACQDVALGAFGVHLDMRPGDMDARRRLAELLRDTGRFPLEVALQEWLVGHGKWPARRDPGRPGERWAWYNEHDGAPRWHRLPAEAFLSLYSDYAAYPTRGLAEADLLRSLHRLGLLSRRC